MKKILSILLLLLILPVCQAFAIEPEVSIHGPETIYAQDSFTLELSWLSEDVTSIAFTLSYDAESLALLRFPSDEMISSPDNTITNRFVLTVDGTETDRTVSFLKFRLKDVAIGSRFWVQLTDVTVKINGTEKQLGTIRWEQSAARPVSTDNYLASLKISDGVLSPAFSPTELYYTAKVSYHIASVDVTAVARDPNAQVRIGSPQLIPDGVTNVAVTVTAEDGSDRVYTIAVTREDDPNRPLSSENDLKNIVVLNYVLSPAFQPNVTEYVLWLPYETTSVDIGGVPKDERATVTVEGNTRLKAGQDNPITITCIAEDGSEKVYTVIAKRAEEYIPQTSAPPTEPMTTEAVDMTASDTQGTESAAQDVQTGSTTDVEIPSWSYVVMAVAAVTGAAAVGILIGERKK